MVCLLREEHNYFNVSAYYYQLISIIVFYVKVHQIISQTFNSMENPSKAKPLKVVSWLSSCEGDTICNFAWIDLQQYFLTVLKL